MYIVQIAPSNAADRTEFPAATHYLNGSNSWGRRGVAREFSSERLARDAAAVAHEKYGLRHPEDAEWYRFRVVNSQLV